MDVLRTKVRREAIQTAADRSPEVFYQVATVDQAMDLWSMGIVMCELLGLRFTQEGMQSEYQLPGRWSMYLGKSPWCSKPGPGHEPAPWPANFVVDAGLAGIDLLRV